MVLSHGLDTSLRNPLIDRWEQERIKGLPDLPGPTLGPNNSFCSSGRRKSGIRSFFVLFCFLVFFLFFVFWVFFLFLFFLPAMKSDQWMWGIMTMAVSAT